MESLQQILVLKTQNRLYLEMTKMQIEQSSSQPTSFGKSLATLNTVTQLGDIEIQITEVMSSQSEKCAAKKCCHCLVHLKKQE
jgi:hypothetical protein